MAISKVLVFGTLAAIGLGLLVSAAQASVSKKVDDTPMTIPVGRVGDEIVWAHFGRTTATVEMNEAPRDPDQAPVTGGDDEWGVAFSEAYTVDRLARTSDRAGVVHDVVVFKSNSTIGPAGTQNEYVDLLTRDAIRTDLKLDYGKGVGIPDAVLSIFSIHPPEVQDLELQGTTLRLGQDVTHLVRSPAEFGGLPIFGFSGSWGYSQNSIDFDADVSEQQLRIFPPNTPYTASVAQRAVVLGHDAYGVKFQASFDPRDLPSDVFGGGNGTAPPELTLGKLTYTRIAWISSDGPYPFLIEDEFRSEGDKLVFEHAQSLAHYRPGRGAAIPWGQDEAKEHYRSTNTDAERTQGTQLFPADGSGSRLPYPLSQALADVQNDVSLVRFQLWRQQNLGAVLVSSEMVTGVVSAGTVPSSYWNLVLAVPNGKAYEVSTERSGAISRPVTKEHGERAVPAFSVTDFPESPVTLAAGERVWASVGAQNYVNAGTNFVHWGFRMDYASGPSCVPTTASIGNNNRGDVRGGDPKRDLGRLVVGYTRSSACVAQPPNNEQGAVVLNTDAGTIVYAYEVRVNFDYRGFPMARENAPPISHEKLIPVGPRPPEPEEAAIASTSFLALFLAAYFLPLAKFAAAQGLVLLPGYSKLSKSNLLDNKVRDDLLEAIKANPGVHASDLGRRVDAGWGTVVYHLGVLEKNQLVSSLVDGRHKRFFPVGVMDWSRRGQTAILMNDTTKALYDLILEGPGVIQGDLAKRVGVTVPSAIWHLKRLEDVGLVGRVKKGRKVHYYVNEGGAAPEPFDPKDAVEVA